MREKFSIDRGERLPNYTKSIKVYSRKYLLFANGIIREFSDDAIYIPLCLIKFMYSYALYFYPVWDTLKSIVDVTNDNLTTTQETDFDTIFNDIVETIVPFTTQSQKQYQVPFEFITRCSNDMVANTLVKILNHSRTYNLTLNILWFMSQIDNASNKNKSIWLNACHCLDIGKIFSKWRRRKKIHHNMWRLTAVMTRHDNDEEARDQLKKNQIYWIILEQLNKINIRHPRWFAGIDLKIINEIIQTFRNFVCHSPSDLYENETNIGIFTTIIETVLSKTTTVMNYVKQQAPEVFQDNILHYLKFDEIMNSIWLKIIECICCLLEYYPTQFMRVLYDSTRIISNNDNIIKLYITLLGSDNIIMRRYIESLLIKFFSHDIDQNYNLIENYIQLGLIKKINSIVKYEYNYTMVMTEDDIIFYLTLTGLIFRCPDQIISPLFVETNDNDDILHFVLYILDNLEIDIALGIIKTIIDNNNIKIVEKIIKFEDGYIFKIFSRKLQQCIDCDDFNQVEVFDAYSELDNSHIYITIYLLDQFTKYTKIQENINNNTELVRFIETKINASKIKSFVHVSLPQIQDIFVDQFLNHLASFLKVLW